MPLRKKVEARLTSYYPDELDRELFTLLVTGGSRGAHRLNEVVSETLAQLTEAGQQIQIIHLTGAPDESFIRDYYRTKGVRSLVYSFHHAMPDLYAMADFAICRAGAATCAELAISGMPALFIPYPHAGNHQLANAKSMAERGMADICADNLLTTEWLQDYLNNILAHMDTIATMSAAAKACAHTHASEELAKQVIITASPALRDSPN